MTFKNLFVPSQVTAGLRRLSQRILGPCSTIQAALPVILSECKPEFFEKTLSLMKVRENRFTILIFLIFGGRQFFTELLFFLQKTSGIFFEKLSSIPELYPVKSFGAMYMLVRNSLACIGNTFLSLYR